MPDHNRFEHSREYSAFLRFGRYMVELDTEHTSQYVDFLLRNSVPLVKWCADASYFLFMREMARSESHDRAVERNFLLMQQWAASTGEPWTDFFRKIATPLAVDWIKSGRISPWVLLTAESAVDLFDRTSDEQQTLIAQAIDAGWWKEKLHIHAEVADNIREILASAGI